MPRIGGRLLVRRLFLHSILTFSIFELIIYIKILLDCDWLISVQLIPISVITVQVSVITVQFFVITVQFSVITVQKSVTN
jgi:hypothetical protein